MNSIVKRLFASSLLLALFSATAIYVGSQMAGAKTPQPTNILAEQFSSDPGDGWMLAGVFLMIVALAVAFAGAMLWMREREN